MNALVANPRAHAAALQRARFILQHPEQFDSRDIRVATASIIRDGDYGTDGYDPDRLLVYTGSDGILIMRGQRRLGMRRYDRRPRRMGG